MLVTVGAKRGICGIKWRGHARTVEKVSTVDTTGAGDAFMAGVLRYVHFNGLPTTT